MKSTQAKFSSSQLLRAEGTKVTFKYIVKFVCGEPNPREEVAARGRYFTAINVINPAEMEAMFRKRFSEALPQQTVGEITKFTDYQSLRPHGAMEIDTLEIKRRFSPPRKWVKGFVELESNIELEVVAVYTAEGPSSRVASIDVERVSPRRIESH